MSGLRVAPIVEGHGEVEAVRPLLTRIWTELLGGEYIDVLRPIRHPRSRLVKQQELHKAVEFAWSRLREPRSPELPGVVVILFDAEPDPPCRLGPQIRQMAQQARPDAAIACALANPEYETWFVAAADSLRTDLDLSESDSSAIQTPETSRSGKKWVADRFRGHYSETVDQPRLTAKMDLALCRGRSPSFDKLCRELEGQLARTQS